MSNFSIHFASVAYRLSNYFINFLMIKNPKLKENLMVNPENIFFGMKLQLPYNQLIIMRKVRDPLENEDNVYSIVTQINITKDSWFFTDHVKIVYSMISDIFNSFREKDGITIMKLRDARKIFTYIAMNFRREHREKDSGFFNCVDEFIVMCDLLTMDDKKLTDLNAIDQNERIVKLFEIFLKNENADQKFADLAKRLFDQFYLLFFPDSSANTIASRIVENTIALQTINDTSLKWMQTIAAWLLNQETHRNHEDALYYLATCYFYGIGVDQDINSALNLWKKSWVEFQDQNSKCKLLSHKKHLRNQ